jgi:hypothetical protein
LAKAYYVDASRSAVNGNVNRGFIVSLTVREYLK